MPDSVKVLVEEVGYQKAVIDQLQNEDCDAIGVKVSTDKRARLITVGNMIECGKIVFPRHGSEELIRQIVGFGVEKYCDLVDAFTLVANKVIELDKPEPNLKVECITYGRFRAPLS
jgi:predicted phage terminase large subunit-like protein